MKVRFIVNPASGKARKAQRLTEALRCVLSGTEGIFEVRVSASRENAAALSREAVRKGYEFVFACGGDGTVNCVASELVGTDTALGIVPSGSGNALASALSIPADTAAAIGLLKTGRVAPMDAGIASGRYFFSTAGFAFEAHLSRLYNEGSITRKIRGVLPYFPLAAIEYFRYRPQSVRVTADGSSLEASAMVLTVANTGQLGGGAVISPEASCNDGLLDICIIRRTGVWKAAGIGIRLFKRTLPGSEAYTMVRAKEALIEGLTGAAAHVDGEPFECAGKASVTVAPGALKVLVPA